MKRILIMKGTFLFIIRRFGECADAEWRRMMKNRMNRITIALGISLVLGLTACGNQAIEETGASCEQEEREQEDDFDEIDLEKVAYNEESMVDGYQNYSISLFQKCVAESNENSNVMISPTSVMMALELVEAGAVGDTSHQITEMICPGASHEEVQSFAADMREQMNTTETVQMSVANSLWINEDRIADRMNDSYVSYVENTFGALATTVPFDEAATTEVNNWVSENTNGMIDQIVDRLSEDACLLLVNAIAFEGEWEQPYEEHQIEDGEFSNSDGSVSDVTMLNGNSDVYYETENATGFIQYYSGQEYAFVAMLPKENQSANEFAAFLTADSYQEFIDSASYDYMVVTQMPEFKSEFDMEMNNVLCNEMGITDAFNPETANFSGIADISEGNLYINRVLHKTFIELDRNGTRAAAVTAIEMTENCCVVEESVIKEVILDRPFAYAIVETETMTPIFIGTMNVIEE